MQPDRLSDDLATLHVGLDAKKLREWPIRVAGVDPDDLVSDGGKALTSDRTRYVVMGISVAITASFSCVALIAALSLAIDGFSALFIPFGIIWGAFIFNLDRWVVSSVDYSPPNSARAVRAAALTLVRLSIAILIGFAIAEPVLLLVFRSEISAITTSQTSSDVREALNVIDRDPKYDPMITDQGRRLKDAQIAQSNLTTTVNNANAALDAEQGGTGGTGQAGDGNRTGERRGDLEQAQRDLLRAGQTVDAAQSDFNSIAGQLKSEQDQAKRDRETGIRGRATGLIDRIKALDTLGKESSVVAVTTWLARALFFLVDLSPVLLKMAAPATGYEARQRAVAQKEEAERVRDFAADERRSAKKRQMQEQADAFEIDQQHRLHDERMARTTDLELRQITAAHAQSIEQSDLDTIEDPGLLEPTAWNPYRDKKLADSEEGEQDKTWAGSPNDESEAGAGDSNEESNDRNPSGPNKIHFDGQPRRNASGHPGDGVAQHVARRWRIGQQLTTPGTSEPWRAAFIAEDLLDVSRRKKIYVVKRIRPASDSAPAATGLNELYSLPFGREISPYVAPIIQGGDDEYFGRYIVTPYYRRGTLQSLIDDPTRSITLRIALTYTQQILQGLAKVADAQLIMHYDIKPSNIAIDTNQIRIIDWGLAAGDGILKKTAVPIGYSLWFAPPEQVNAKPGKRRWRSARCDIRAVGATLYALITGVPPLFVEARVAGLVDSRGHLKPRSEDTFRKLLAVTQPAPLDAFFSVNEGWDRAALRPLSDLIARWLDPAPENRVSSEDKTEIPQESALRDLREMFEQLTRQRVSALTNEVGARHLTKHPLVEVGDLSDVDLSSNEQETPHQGSTVIRPAKRRHAGGAGS